MRTSPCPQPHRINRPPCLENSRPRVGIDTNPHFRLNPDNLLQSPWPPINRGPAETPTIEVRRSSECRGSAGSQIGKAGCFTRIRNVSCLRGLDRFVIKRYPSKAPIKTRGELAPQLRRASFEAKSFGSQPGLRSPRFSNPICRVEALRLMDSQLPQPAFPTRRRGEVDERRVSRRHAPLGARRRTWTVR